MTQTRRRHTVSLIALLSLLLAMVAPAAAFAETDNATTDEEVAAESAEESEASAESTTTTENSSEDESGKSDSSESGDTDKNEPHAEKAEKAEKAEAKGGKDYADSDVVDDKGKINVCKYVGQPGVDERLKTGKNPIEVSWNSIGADDYTDIQAGDAWTDAQGRSIVVAHGADCPAADGGPEEVLDVSLTVDDSVCEEITYVIDASDSTNLDEVTVTGTIYLGETFYHEETITLDDSNDFTETIVGAPGVGDYTLVWEATAGDNTTTGELDFTVQDCDTVADSVVDVDINIDTEVCEEVTYVNDGSASTNVGTVTVTGTVKDFAGVAHGTETIELTADNDYTATVTGSPLPGDYFLEWEAVAGEASVTGLVHFTVKDCVEAPEEVLDVTLTVDDDVCEEITYVIDATDSDNVDEITVTGTLYLGGTFYHEETHTLDGSNNWTKTIVGEPGVGDYTLVWEATAGDQTVTGELDFTVQDCDTTGGDSTDAVDKVEICHATASPTNPYVVIEPAVDGVLNGHADQHTGPVFEDGMENGEWGDIIPAFSYLDKDGDAQQFEGQNWDALGQSVYDDGCAVGDLEPANPAISIDKSADVDTVTFTGDDDTAEVTYTYEITNTGNITLDLTELSDDKIADLDVSDVDLDDTTLEADESTTVTMDAELGADDFDEDGEHTNVATVTAVIEDGDVDDTDDTVTDTDDETVSIDDDTVADGVPAVDITAEQECGVAYITVTNTDLPDDWQYGVTVQVDGEDHDSNLVVGNGTDTITVNLDEDQSDGEAVVTYFVTDATEWDLIDSALQDGAVRMLDVDTDCEDDGTGGDGVPPVVVQPDIEDDGPLRICIGTDATLTLEAMFDDLDDSEDFDFTELELALDAGDLDLEDHGLDADDLVFDANGNFNATLTDLPLGTHVIAYTVTLDGETVQSDDIEVRVTVCPPFPEIPVDGDADGVPMIAVDYDVVCPDGVAGFTVNATGTDLDTNDAEILVAYDAESAPYWSGDITLGDELALRWPVDADGLELDTFVFWVSVDGVTSDLVMVDNTDLECVLGEVIDQPDVDGNDEDAPVGGDDVIDDDEAVREDDEVVTNDDEDEVMGVVLDADEAGDADDAAAGSWLPRTGTSVLALLAAGLFSLLTGAGLLRRRS